jgi:hypothetical protein
MLFQGSLFNVLREKRSVGDPTGARAEEAPRPPVESERLMTGKERMSLRRLVFEASLCVAEINNVDKKL